MTVQEIRDQILALNRSLFLEAPKGQQGYRHQFLASHAVIEMWETDASRLITWKLAKEAAGARPKLAHGDRESYGKLLIEAIKQRLFQPAFYNFPLPSRGALFAHIASSDLNGFADAQWSDFLSAAEASVQSWLTIYPLPKIKFTVPSQTFGHLKMLATTDSSAWQNLAAKFPAIARFEPLIGQLKTDNRTYGFHTLADVWLVAEQAGTVEAARRRAARDMSILIALIFATSKKGGRFLKSGADPVTRTIQISDVADGASTIQFSYLGELLPPLLGDLNFDGAMQAEIQTWYGNRAATSAKAGRASTAAAFYHHGIIADDLERFVHLFVVMDALFGVPYQVGQKIKDGTAQVFPGEPKWVDRATKLYALRNAIVHGDISDLADWSGNDDYFTQFGVKPEVDVITLSTTSLLRFFDFP